MLALWDQGVPFVCPLPSHGLGFGDGGLRAQFICFGKLNRRFSLRFTGPGLRHGGIGRFQIDLKFTRIEGDEDIAFISFSTDINW